jgi:hypothetical protein
MILALVLLMGLALVPASTLADDNNNQGQGQDEQEADQGQDNATHCNGPITGRVDGDIVVDPGVFCIALGAVIDGNVIVLPGAVGFHTHHSLIEGNITATRPVLDIRVLDSQVGRNVTITGTTLGSVGATCRSSIGGNLELFDNAGAMFFGQTGFGGVCTGPDTIHGNMVLAHNSGSYDINSENVMRNLRLLDNVGGVGGHITLENNRIIETLDCRGNVPPPTGAANDAETYSEQCPNGLVF